MYSMYIPKNMTKETFTEWLKRPQNGNLIGECYLEVTFSGMDNCCRTGNMYEMTDRLITDTGRFCMCHASDILHEIRTMECTLQEKDLRGKDTFLFAVRTNGVDNMDEFMDNYRKHDVSYLAQYYRSISVIYADACPGNDFIKLVMKQL